MCRAVRLRLKRCCTAFFFCRRRSAAPARSSAEGSIMSEALANLAEHLTANLGGALLGTNIAYGELNVDVVPDEIVNVLTFLRDDAACQFVAFVDISGADYP